MNIIIGISGKIGSGKTTLAEYLSSELKIHIASFGDYVRYIANHAGIKIERKELQSLGHDLLENDLEEFCKNVLSHGKWDGQSSLIIDGIRHIKVLEQLKKLVYPLPLYLIYL
jgi:cytidylate kinase